MSKPSGQQHTAQALRRSQRLAKKRRTREAVEHTTDSHSSSDKSSASKKRTASALGWTQIKATLRLKLSKPPPEPESEPESEPPDYEQHSFLEEMTGGDASHALSYYYDYVDEMPYRESGAIRRADDPAPQVLVEFDETIFARKMCLDAVPEDDLESVDPFTLDAGPRVPLQDCHALCLSRPAAARQIL